MKQGRIIILSGPSGVGKGTVLKQVMQSDDSLRFSVSATTRPFARTRLTACIISLWIRRTLKG